VNPRKPAMKIGEISVCLACLRTKFERAEIAAGQCRCGSSIVAMPRSEVEARRSDKR
jgi:hypothetical protein